MADAPEHIEADDDFFDDDLEDAQTAAAAAFESGDIDDELPLIELEDEELLSRPDEQAGAEDDPEFDQNTGIREPEGDAS